MKNTGRGSKPLRPVAATRSSKLHPLIIKFLELGDPEKEAYLADLATQGKDTHVARYRKYWAAQQAGKLTRHDRDFADQKSRKGEVFIGVSHEIAAALQDRFAELGLTFKSGNRGEQFLREKEGSGKWSVADALDYQDLLDLIESSRRHFFYDEVCSDGVLRTKKKKLQVSKESAGKREPTPLSKVEVQFPPMVMRQLAFLRADMLAAGKTEADFEKAALGLVEELLPILVDHMERRTGQRVVGAFGHFDSGFFHLGFWLTRVGENLRQIGVAQLGLTGRVNIGWHSQVTAGYKLPSGAAEKYARHMALMRDRYKPGSEQAKAALGRGAKFDGMAVDLGLSDRLMKFFREEAAPVVGYWARGCEVYRAYLEATEPQKEAKRGEKKMLREQVTRALLAEGEKVGLKARELALETQRRQVQVALEKGLAASGLADEPLRSGIREVTGEFALNRLVEAVISGQLDLIVLWEQAKAGVEALLEWLRNLFKVESPELSKPVEKAPEVPVVHADRLAEEWELSWLEELEGYPTAPVGEELALVVANVKRGLWGGSGLSESQRNIVAVQMVELQLWIEAEAARRLVPPTPPPPTPVEKTQDIGVVGASEIAFDETPARPAAEAKFRELLEFVPESWRKGVAPEAMPAREAGVERRVRLLSRLLVENRLGDFSGRRRGGVCSAEMKARWMLADLPFPRFEQACWKIVGGMPIDEAREFVEREEMPK